MWAVVAGAVAGAWMVGRQKPHSHVRKRHVLGCRSGTPYECDDFIELGLVAVHAPELGVRAAFVRTPEGFRLFRASGPELNVNRLVLDLTGKTLAQHRAKPSQPPPAAAASAIPPNPYAQGTWNASTEPAGAP